MKTMGLLRGVAVVCAAGVSLGLLAPSPALAAAIAFRDVSSTTPHAEDIRWMAGKGISTGWRESDGSYTFRGMGTVVRQDMAAFLRREAARFGIANAKGYKPDATDWKRFRDVDRSTPHAEDILWLASTGITTGYADGTFRGMTPVYRQDMAAFLKRLADRNGKDLSYVSPKTDFSDVTSRTPHVAEVQWLGGSGISQGYRNSDGSWRFEGMTPVYRQDMAAFIHRLDDHLNCDVRMQQVMVSPERTETVIDQPAWTETIPAVTEQVFVPEVSHVETVMETQYCEVYYYSDGTPVSIEYFNNLPAKDRFNLLMQHGGSFTSTRGNYDYVQIPVTKTIIDTPAHYETKVITPEQTINHPATYKQVTIPAVYETKAVATGCLI